MRVLIVHDFLEGGGAEIMAHRLTEGLKQRGFETRLSAAEVRWRPQGPLGLADRCFSPKSYFRLRRQVADFQPDAAILSMVLQRHSPSCLLALEGIPTYYWAQMYEAICPVGTKLLPDGRMCQVRSGWSCFSSGCLSWKAWPPLMGQKWLWNRWSQGLSGFLTTSRWMADRFRADGRPVDDVIYPGLPLPALDARPDASPRVLCVARLCKEKGVESLLQAFLLLAEAHPDATLEIVGDGPERTKLQEMAAELDHRIVFAGELSYEEVSERAAGAWVQVVPSLWQEPFGLVAVEAQLMGLPVVASNFGGLCEIVEDRQSGLLVPPGLPSIWADALDRLLSDETLRRSLGERGRQRARKLFTLERCLDNWERRLLETKKTRP